VAAAGALMAVAGSLVTSGDQLAESGFDGGTPERAPGIALSLLLVVVGYALVLGVRQGPLAIAGVATTIGAVPSLVWFLTLDTTGFGGADSSAVLGFSALVWAASYAGGGGRGRAAYLGAAGAAVWLLVMEQVEPVVGAPFSLFFFVSPFATGNGGAAFDANGLAVVALLFGAGYLVAARALDRRGLPGMATPFVAVGDVALLVGVVLLAFENEAVVVGLVATAVGALLAVFGSRRGRRATTWLGAFGVFAGMLAVVGDTVDEATPFGLVVMLVGAIVVASATVVSTAMGEPVEEG
jgi:hypothetical protein